MMIEFTLPQPNEGGSPVYLNADHIIAVQQTAFSNASKGATISSVGGATFRVRETLDEVIARIRAGA